MSVPEEDAELARAALGARREGVTTLDITHDTLVDGPLPEPWPGDPETPVDRSLLFGRPPEVVRVDVRYDEGGPDQLLVRTSWAGEVSVEALRPQPGGRLVLSGPPPLLLQVPAPGPLSLLLARPAEPGSPPLQTAWLVF